MRRSLLWLLLIAACSTSSSPPPTFVHQAPAFAIDLPADFKAAAPMKDPMNGDVQRFDGPNASQYLAVSWKPSTATAVEERNEVAATRQETGQPAADQGELPNGAAWLSTRGTDGPGVEVFLISDGQLLDCQGDGPAPVIAACKSLRVAK